MRRKIKKRVKRALIDKEVIINGVVRAEALDISREGMYIYTQANFIPEAVFELKFKINGKEVKAMARVKHMQPGIGVGVEFVEISKGDKAEIKKYTGG